ncbi:MAG: LysR family transcriptional regulator [Gammaproteobacteria bacterium]|nr:LysR family transcriptional regulator [Gammaproteobacteria bacterium]
MTRTPYYKQNRLKQLRAFCQSAKLGSISRAAETLFLSQPSVSLQIQALERELDTELFERRGPSIRLTAHGAALLDLASPLVHGIDSISDSFAGEIGNLNQGEINIAAGESTILYLLPKALKKFTAAFPDVKIKLHNVTGRDGLKMLRSGDVDFKTVLITPEGHPLAKKTSKTIRLEDIEPFGLILPPRYLSTWRMVETIFTKHSVNYSVNLEAGGWEVIKKYVQLGLGVSIVISICLDGSEKVAKIPLDKYFPNRNYGVVIQKSKYLSPQARQFIKLITLRSSRPRASTRKPTSDQS